VQFPYTATVIDECEQALDSAAIRGTSVEAYLVQYALVVAYAEIEDAIKAIIRTRLDIAAAPAVKTLLGKAVDKLYRGPKKESLSEFIACFGKNVADHFNSRLDPIQVTRYGNLITNRHEIAHKRGVHLTFDELKDAIHAAQIVVISFDEVIAAALSGD
jgi:RiboL-PSP-HEPN